MYVYTLEIPLPPRPTRSPRPGALLDTPTLPLIDAGSPDILLQAFAGLGHGRTPQLAFGATRDFFGRSRTLGATLG